MSRISERNRHRWVANRAKAQIARMHKRTALGDNGDLDVQPMGLAPGLLLVAPFVIFGAITLLGTQTGARR